MGLPPLEEIKAKKLVQWAVAYLAGAWVVLQVVVALGGVYGWPVWLMRAVPVLLGVGFFIVLVIAWYHGEKGRQRVGWVELGVLATICCVGGVAVLLMTASDDGPATSSTDTVDLSALSDTQALELAYDWGTGGNPAAATQVLEQLIERAESDSTRMTLLATGASLLSRNEEHAASVEWMMRLMDIDPVSLTLSATAGSDVTRSYLDALRHHYAENSAVGPVESVAVLPQAAYTVGFPDSLREQRRQLAEGLPVLLQVSLLDPLGEIPLLSRSDIEAKQPLPIQEVSVGLPDAYWFWADEASMPGSFLRASHYLLSYCTFLGVPFESGGVASLTCTSRLISTQGKGVRASAQSRGDITDLLDLTTELAVSIASQISS